MFLLMDSWHRGRSAWPQYTTCLFKPRCTSTPQQSYAYLNNGTGVFPAGDLPCNTSDVICLGSLSNTNDVVLGDLDQDGDLDIVKGNFSQPNQVMLNNGHAVFEPPVQIEPTSGIGTFTLALGDIDADTNLDLIAASNSQTSCLYRNEGDGHFAPCHPFGSTGGTTSMRLGDFNGDGAQDVAAASGRAENGLYLNDRQGNLRERIALDSSVNTDYLVVGDIDNDGSDDLVKVVNPLSGGGAYFLRNGNARADRQPNTPPYVSVQSPGARANFYATATVLDQRVVPISYRLYDRENDLVRHVRAYYSLDGGNRWTEAKAAATTQTDDLAASPTGVQHTFDWDVYASGVFGTSDNVVVRIVAYASSRPRSWSVSLNSQRPSASASTFPFRMRGMRIRVIDQNDSTVPNALVYRLAVNASSGAQPFPERFTDAQPLTTDAQGYLRGHGTLTIGDRLAALQLVQTVNDVHGTYSLYHTSAAPIPTGLALQNVTTDGVQNLRILPANSLTLFHLTVSLEWDARGDVWGGQEFLAQLQEDFERTSEFLFRWSGGQVALGQIDIYQARERWNDAQVRIYASNRLWPNAVRGGIVTAETTDPGNSSIVYYPGQVRMAAEWNRFGQSAGTLGEDWPRTLAHELGHFALYLDDNYLGLDAAGRLINVDGCRSPMSDPYRDDYGEFAPASLDWDTNCSKTLAEHDTGRADWETITTFYGSVTPAFALHPPTSFDPSDNPRILPLQLSHVTINPAQELTRIVNEPFYFAVENGTQVNPSPSARVVLLQDKRLIELGRPQSQRVLARGARTPNAGGVADQVCIYDTIKAFSGCTTVDGVNKQIQVTPTAWQPNIELSPVTSTTLQIAVSELPAGLALRARLYPSSSDASDDISLTYNNGRYAAILTSSLERPAFEGVVHLQIISNTTGQKSDAFLDYALGGNPGRAWARNAPRGNPGRAWARNAPAISSDGQAIIYGADLQLQEGQFFLLQGSAAPPAPPGIFPVGRSYRLATTPGVNFAKASLNINYLTDDVPSEGELGIGIYHWDTSVSQWIRLNTIADLNRNDVSASISSAGLYMVMVDPKAARSQVFIPFTKR